ncbi:hypothetical protein Baya_12695 [Bagarius yarrelli]|uniref:Uncharacterized protein n=1 Tax=Bagarius yarrelli TaxID=175774 RepID=A0A556V3S0_BAGYA|nr:hypothetical protein Baya_12695 [Bagarius yarrelli]
MCIDVMATEDRKQRDALTNWWRSRNSLYAGFWKSSPRKLRHGRYSPVWRKQKQTDAFPSGAMAPRNTTQYLMELAYSELNITAPSSKKNCPPPQHENTNSYTSVFTDEDNMDFQHRDFESVFFQNEL